jgi:beta-glucanase (GH16 family)
MVMKKILVPIVLLFLVTYLKSQEMKLVWSDEFDGTKVNTEKWNFETGNGVKGWGNHEKQYYTNRPENVHIENGILKITAVKDSFEGFQYTSTRMHTKNKGFWKYGRIESRIKLPIGRGVWPAFWMLPQNHNYGTLDWPDNGEIDIMEYVGYMPGKIFGTVHTNKNFGGNGVGKNIEYPKVENDFHVFAISWNADSINWYFDNTMYSTYYRQERDWHFWPFDKDFYCILNFAVGGDWGGAKGIDKSIFPQTYEIDYVRVYQPSGK